MATNDPSGDSPEPAPRGPSWRDAYDRTLKLANLVLAPALVVQLVVNLQAMLDLLVARPATSLAVLGALTAVFVGNLVDLRRWRRRLTGAAGTVARRSWRLAAYAASIVAVAALLGLGALTLTSGIHFVIVASAPDREAARREAAAVNAALARRDVDDLRARAYGSSPGNPWWAIVVGGPHFSQAAAAATLARARALVPEHVDAGAWIKSYDARRWLSSLLAAAVAPPEPA